MDINAEDFVTDFVAYADKAVVGVIGHGYVGQAVSHFFKTDFDVLVYDKAKTGEGYADLSDVVRRSHLIFVCVPTPMRNDGSCYTGIVDDVLNDIVQTARSVERDLKEFVVVVKSTVYPGYTSTARDSRPGLRLVFSPEFLTERNSIKDFEKINRIILGGDINDARVVFKFFEERFGQDVINAGNVVIAACDSTVAELVKLFTNACLMTKVLFSNEMYQLCQRMGVVYEDVRLLATLDARIGSSHTVVPGHDGELGAGGHCFPKDIHNLRNIFRNLGVQEKLLTAVIERNDELRGRRDWEEMKGRAVIDE